MRRPISPRLRHARPGVTLVEVGLVVLFLFIFAAMILIALDPPAQYRRTRNRQRLNDIQAIAAAIFLYEHDRTQGMPALDYGDGDMRMITNGPFDEGCSHVCTAHDEEVEIGCIDLSVLVTEGYLPRVPLDPKREDFREEFEGIPDYVSFYALSRNRNEMHVLACNPEPEGDNNELPTLHVIR